MLQKTRRCTASRKEKKAGARQESGRQVEKKRESGSSECPYRTDWLTELFLSLETFLQPRLIRMTQVSFSSIMTIYSRFCNGDGRGPRFRVMIHILLQTR